MLLTLLLFLFSLAFGSELRSRDRLTLSDIVAFNTPSYVDGLFADTHSLGLSVQTHHLHFSGLKLVNEAFVHFDPKKMMLRTLTSNEGRVIVFSGAKPIDGAYVGQTGLSYTVKEGDLVVMIASWIDILDYQKEDLTGIIQAFDTPVDIGDHYLDSIDIPDHLCFIIAKVVRRSDVKPTFIRLRKQERRRSSDSFEGPLPLQPIGSGTLRLPSLVLGWSSEDDFDQTFVPKDNETDLETETTLDRTDSTSDNVFASDQHRKRRFDKENCSVQ